MAQLSPRPRPLAAPTHRALTREAILSAIEQLPAFPAALMKALDVLSVAQVDNSALCRVLERDAVICGRVLKMANTMVALRGTTRRVTDLNRAISVLGYRTVKSVVLATIARAQQGVDAQRLGYTQDGLWEHAVGVGLLARRWAEGHVKPDVAQLGGLFHDVGRLLTAEHLFPHEDEWADARRLGTDSVQIERHLGLPDHAEIGALVIERWDLPQVIADVVAHHHQPDHATSNLTAVSLIHLADVAANRLGIGLMEPWPTPLHPFARKCLNWEQRDLDAEMQATREDPTFQQELEWLVHL